MSGWIFLVLFVTMWLGITTLLAYLSGWFRLMRLFPDKPEEARLILRWESGSMGIGVHFGRVLVLSACASGLRIGVFRIFGPFSKSFLIPWHEIRVLRYRRLFWNFVELRFGIPEEQGKLLISEFLANTIAASAGTSWPETTPASQQNKKTAGHDLLRLWLLQTSLAATFFTLVPRLVAPPQGRPPVWVGICFPAVVFGVMEWVQYFLRRSALKKAADLASKSLR